MYENNDNIDYAEVFGEDITTETEADDTSVGENGSVEGESETDVDDNAESSENDGGETAATSDPVTEGDSKGAQSAEDNTKYAAARREAERKRDEAINEANTRHERELSEIFAAVGLVNPYTGKPVTNMDELKEYNKAKGDSNKKLFMEKNGLTEAEYDEFVSGLPEVAAARQAQAEAKTAKDQADAAKSESIIEAEIGLISKLDPNIKNVDDLLRDESYERILPYVKRGYSLSDAYKIANYDKLTGAASASARQQVLNAQSGKAHLTQSESRGSGIESVPAEVRAQYRDFNPEMSDAEIAREWAKYQKQTKNK